MNMPIYDYECKSCGVFSEELVRIADRLAPTESPCVNCGEKEVKQVHLTLNIGDSIRLGVKRPGAEFNDVIDKIKHHHPLAQFQPRHGIGSEHQYALGCHAESHHRKSQRTFLLGQH